MASRSDLFFRTLLSIVSKSDTKLRGAFASPGKEPLCSLGLGLLVFQLLSYGGLEELFGEKRPAKEVQKTTEKLASILRVETTSDERK